MEERQITVCCSVMQEPVNLPASKAILNQYYDQGLRIIEVYKHQFAGSESGVLRRSKTAITNLLFTWMIFLLKNLRLNINI